LLAAWPLAADDAVLTSQPRTATRPGWHTAPSLSIMTGFIYDKWIDGLVFHDTKTNGWTPPAR